MKDYSSIIVSSKIKFRRNLVGFNFPMTLDDNTEIKVLNKIADTILKIDKEFKVYKLKTLPELDKNIMFEKGLISRNLISNSENSAAILSKDEDIVVMVNEEDHIVETCKIDGLNLIYAYDKLNVLDNELLSRLDIAYDDEFGFLTSNIDKVGTGLDVCVKLFLPGLKLTNRIGNIQNEIQVSGYNVKFETDDSNSKNEFLFTISNNQTIGKKESEYVIKITELAIKICEMEVAARNELLTNNYIDDVKDMVYRAWGIITNCYKISESEAQSYLYKLKFGDVLDLIRFKEVNCLESLLVDVLPYSLTKISGMKITFSDLEKYRAKFLASVLKTKRIK